MKIAVLKKFHPIHYAAATGNIEDFKKSLLKEGGTIDVATDPDGWTSLMCAAKYNQLNTVEYLLSKGAFKNSVNKDGQDALAIAKAAGHMEIVDCLNVQNDNDVVRSAEDNEYVAVNAGVGADISDINEVAGLIGAIENIPY